MEEYKGKIVLRNENFGTKSEGYCAYLECIEGQSMPLCRNGQYPINDPYFEPYDGIEVTISGTENHNWLIVGTITPASSSETIVPLEDPAPEHPETANE